MVNEEGGVDPEQFRMEAMFDRVEAIGKGVLGLTVQCAQCHTHKFDPISHEEYYRLFAFLNNDDEPTRVVYTPDEQRMVADIRRGIREVEDGDPPLQPRLARADGPLGGRAGQGPTSPKWTVLQAPFEDISTGGQKYLLLPDGSFRAAGYAPTKHTGKFTVKADLPKITAFRLELMNDANLPAYGSRPVALGDLRPDRVQGRGRTLGKDRKAVKFTRASADFEQTETPLEAYYDDQSGTSGGSSARPRTRSTARTRPPGGSTLGPGRRNVRA